MAQRMSKNANDRLFDFFMTNRISSLRTVAIPDHAMDNDPDVRFQTAEGVAAAVRATAGGNGPFTAYSAARGVDILL